MRTVSASLLVCCFCAVSSAAGQEPESPQSDSTQVKRPQIAEEPRAVDPATLVPPKLAARATVDFSDSSLQEVVRWLLEKQGIPVVIDRNALEEEDILVGEPVSDRLENAPIYQLLNRLRALKLAWYFNDEVLYITTHSKALERKSTTAYNVGDLIDDGYDGDLLTDLVRSSVFAEWQADGGEGGSVQLLGDVLFVRHASDVHIRVRGLLTAIRKHARRTFTFDPPSHELLRSRLGEKVSVDFRGTPLIAAVAELARKSKTNIRLDTAALADHGVRAREPISLTLSDRRLETVLNVVIAPHQLTTMLRDGVLWVTTKSVAKSGQHHLTAVYDVRDLCRTDDESSALFEAIISQSGLEWEDDGGAIEFPKPGVMVVRHDDQGHQHVTRLLAAYREALRVSKPRKKVDRDQEILTRYYRLQVPIAVEMETVLRELIRSPHWPSEEKPNAPGRIRLLQGGSGVLRSGKTESGVLVPYSVLMITQSRETHRKIGELFDRVEAGDATLKQDAGLGGGGFGGGFFSVRSAQSRKNSQRKRGSSRQPAKAKVSPKSKSPR